MNTIEGIKYIKKTDQREFKALKSLFFQTLEEFGYSSNKEGKEYVFPPIFVAMQKFIREAIIQTEFDLKNK
jgi:hypothetical protein